MAPHDSAPHDSASPVRPDAASVLRGLLPAALTVLVLVAVVVVARAGTGVPALLAAGAVVAGGSLVMVVIGRAVPRHAAHDRRERSGVLAADRPGDLAAEWASVEPAWSGRH